MEGSGIGTDSAGKLHGRGGGGEGLGTGKDPAVKLDVGEGGCKG